MEEIELYYKKHSKQIYCFLMNLVHDPKLAVELTQETFYQANLDQVFATLLN